MESDSDSNDLQLPAALNVNLHKSEEYTQYITVLQIIALAMVFSCVLRKLDDDDEREELAEANAHPEKDEETIAKEEDPVLMLGEPPKSIRLPILKVLLSL